MSTQRDNFHVIRTVTTNTKYYFCSFLKKNPVRMNWLQHKRPIIRKLLKFALDLQGMSLNTVFEKKLLLHVKYTIYDRFDCAQHRLRSNCVQPDTFVQERSIRKVCLRTQICACVWVSLSFSLPPLFFYRCLPYMYGAQRVTYTFNIDSVGRMPVCGCCQISQLLILIRECLPPIMCACVPMRFIGIRKISTRSWLQS